MGTVHCPLCGLRFPRPSELDQHAVNDHAPPVAHTQDRITVPRVHVRETALDRVLGSRAR